MFLLTNPKETETKVNQSSTRFECEEDRNEQLDAQKNRGVTFGHPKAQHFSHS